MISSLTVCSSCSFLALIKAEQARERDPALSPIEDVSPSLEMEEAGEHGHNVHRHKQVGSMIHHNQHHLSQHALRVKENDLGQEKG